MPQTKERISAFLAILLILLSGYYAYKNGLSITGPFIFGDELEYFSYARDLFLGADLSSHTQYGLLYPALGAPFFGLDNIDATYKAFRLLNVALLVSSGIPAFLLVRMLLPKSCIRFFFPVFVVTAPFSGFVYLIWAEPLYYTLFLWTVFFLICFYRQPGVVVGSVSGAFLGLLFHTKPGAGVIVQIAALLSFIVLVGITPSSSRKRLVAPILASGISCGILTIPWMVRNLNLGVGIIGYAGGATGLTNIIYEFGYRHLAKEVGLSVFYQLSYVFIGTWGLLGFLLVLPVMRWRTFSKENATLLVFAVLCTGGLVCLSALGMVAYPGLEYWMPNGRYLSVIFPLLILLSLFMLDSVPGASEKFWLFFITTIFFIVTFFATPLLMLRPFSFVNNPELALPTWIIDKGLIVWRSRYEPSISERIVFAEIFGIVGFVLVLVAKWRTPFFLCVILVFVGNLFTSRFEHEYIRIIGESQSGLNNVIKSIHLKKIVDKNIAYDIDIKPSGNVDFMTRFWTASNGVEYMDQKEIVDNLGNTLMPDFFITYKKMVFPISFSSETVFVYRVNVK